VDNKLPYSGEKKNSQIIDEALDKDSEGSSGSESVDCASRNESKSASKSASGMSSDDADIQPPIVFMAP
jgi:hypothetical protein